MRRLGVLAGLGLLAACVGAEPSLHAELGAANAATAGRLLQLTLESDADGAGRQWSGEGGGQSGSVRPLRTFIATDGRICRDFEEFLAVGDRTATYRGTACRTADRGWAVL